MNDNNQSSRHRVNPNLVNLLISILASVLILVAQKIFTAIPLSVSISVSVTLVVTSLIYYMIIHRKDNQINEKLSSITSLEKSIKERDNLISDLEYRVKDELKSIVDIGIIGLWKDEQSFYQYHKMSYTEYCRNFIKNTSDAETVKILGYDWIELFPDTTVLGDDIFLEKGSRLSFKVILADPESPITIEKRAWEMEWKSPKGEFLYPEGQKKESLLRIKRKIESCINVAKIFEDSKPQFFKLKLTNTLPCFSILMNSNTAIGTIYNMSHKGKDSVIFIAKNLKNINGNNKSKISEYYGNTFYGYLNGYFDAVWENPSWRCLKITLLNSE